MELNRLKAYLGSDWQALSCQVQADGSYRITGLFQAQARVLYLSPLTTGGWRVQERGQSWFPSGRDGNRSAGAAPKGEPDNVEQAPMDGLLREIRATVGTEIQAGEVLYILESMKMQVQICAPCAGQVVKIGVYSGVQIRKGQEILKWKGNRDA